MNPPRGPWLERIYGLTILLGAFLLFLVQPLLSKWILPWFGGGPAVWTTCMLFFQSALLAGYAFAHVSERCFSDTLKPAVLAGLIVAAAMLLPIGPDDSWKRTGSGNPTWRILLLLAASVGAPYFLLSTTGPLVQAWHSRAYPGRSPYRMYALSNMGSLAALLSYPVVFETLWGLKGQAILWAGMFLAFLVLYAVGAASAWRLSSSRPSAAGEAAGDLAPSAGRVVLWVALPALASWMLLASTNQLCQDLVVIPFLWVLPLAVYLSSFIVSFDRPRWYKPGLYALLTAGLSFAAACMVRADYYTMMLVPGVLVILASLFCLCMLCHGELARLKPAPRHLTGYYLAVSGGGALGGIFVSLAAPRLFSSFWEWNLGMAAGYAAACARLFWIHRDRIRAHKYAAALFMSVAAAGFVLIGVFSGFWRTPLEAARNYYGVVTVREFPGRPPHERPRREMYNGPILHGLQYLNEEDRFKPTTYYVEASGVGRAMAFFRDRRDMRVGVVGLGVGTLAAYGRFPTQAFRFYEINPEVVRLSGKHFTFLRDCRGRVDVALGDARLSLEREPPQRFHVLALDAFSGDTIPTHLLTVEAMEIYLAHLDPGGVLAFHITNRCLDLAPVVRGLARRYGLKAVVVEYAPGEGEIGYSCDWILCTRDEAAYREMGKGVREGGDTREVFWTDDCTNLLSVLKMR